MPKDPESTYRQGPTRSWVNVKLRHEGVFELIRAARYERLGTSPFGDLPRMRGAVWIPERFHAEVSYAEVLAGSGHPFGAASCGGEFRIHGAKCRPSARPMNTAIWPRVMGSLGQ